MTEEKIAPVPGVKPGSFAAWCVSFRPKTLGIAAAPVAVGLAVSAAVTHTFDIVVAIATLALSLLMQAISNMENDAGYTKRRAERKTRKGLPRSTANGWLTVEQVERMIKILIGVVVLDTLFLIYVGGWVMMVISAASVIAAYAYMGGPKPIAYTPWGEFVVFIFFVLLRRFGAAAFAPRLFYYLVDVLDLARMICRTEHVEECLLDVRYLAQREVSVVHLPRVHLALYDLPDEGG